ncbi:hypothetical protein J3F84DRAFT_366647 [Trichoderma pleuroticola]
MTFDETPSASIDASAIQLARAQQIPALVRGSGAGTAPTPNQVHLCRPINASRAWRA